MSRARQTWWLSFATLVALLLMGRCAVQAQDTERAQDDTTPPRGARRGRGGFPGANPLRPAVDADRAADTAPTTDRESVDTSRNQREVYRAAYTPVHSLATTLERHYRGVPGLSLVAEPSSNSLLISASPERFKELLDTIRKLDRTPRSAAIEVTILDIPGADDGKEISAQEFLGPSDAARAKIIDLKKRGHIQRVRRFRLTALDNQVTNLQANGDRPAAAAPGAAAGAGGFFPGARQGNAGRFPNAGTTVQCTARIAAEKGVVIELSVRDTPAAVQANRDEQPPPEGVASQFLGTLSIPPATTVVAGEIATETETGPSRVVILVSAEVIEGPPEKPLAGGAR